MSGAALRGRASEISEGFQIVIRELSTDDCVVRGRLVNLPMLVDLVGALTARYFRIAPLAEHREYSLLKLLPRI